jgi:hypothetical protein
MAGMVWFRARLRFLIAFPLVLWCASASAQQATAPSSPPGIQDNSFLIEEAYNQEQNVVQHINAFTRFWDSKDFVYTFTQEWPVPGDWRHQLSYTLPVQHVGALPGSGEGIGDVLLNYRYQIVGDGESRLAIAPRFSLLFSSGEVSAGRGSGGLGYQTNLPVSYVIRPTIVAHSNFGVTVVPRARDAEDDRATTTAVNYGQSVIWLVHPRINLMLEAVGAAFQSVDGPDQTSWSRTFFVSPGVRWSYNFSNGLQIVPGVAVPIGVGPSRREHGVILYLSFEHPFR